MLFRVSATIVIEFLRPLFKYPATLFILLLIGYGQLFAPLIKNSAVYSPVKICKASTYYQSPPLKGEEKEVVFIEEEEDDERGSFKRYSVEYTACLLPYSPGYFIQHIKNGLSFHEPFFHSAFSRSAILMLCVFRL